MNGVSVIAEKIVSQLDLFERNLPYRPYCSDEKSWLRIRPKSTAIGKKYIQHNPPSLIHWLVYDCDYPNALEHVVSKMLPVPNVIATNPENGNSHLFYKLADPVCTSDVARIKPLSLLSKIDYALSKKLNADAGYQGLVCKNILHQYWDVEEVNQSPWKLADFLNRIEVPKRLPKKAKVQGVGRNCTMFENARLWAYSQVLSYRVAGNKKAFEDAVLRHCEDINEGFATPLLSSEVRGVARNISRWTWKKYIGSYKPADEWAVYVAETHTSEKQRARQVKQVETRNAATKKKREEAIRLREKGLTQQAIADQLGTSQRTISTWLKQSLLVPTAPSGADNGYRQTSKTLAD